MRARIEDPHADSPASPRHAAARQPHPSLIGPGAWARRPSSGRRAASCGRWRRGTPCREESMALRCGTPTSRLRPAPIQRGMSSIDRRGSSLQTPENRPPERAAGGILGPADLAAALHPVLRDDAPWICGDDRPFDSPSCRATSACRGVASTTSPQRRPRRRATVPSTTSIPASVVERLRRREQHRENEPGDEGAADDRQVEHGVAGTSSETGNRSNSAAAGIVHRPSISSA